MSDSGPEHLDFYRKFWLNRTELKMSDSGPEHLDFYRKFWLNRERLGLSMEA